MATRFSTVYKQELKNKGVLSSMGSSVLKSARERMDVRNMFFGGKGMLSATGQKVFGRGYSALSSGATGAPSSAQAAAQSAVTSDLLSSNERQEALLRVVAKNTFNMNLMARDMNITRQNIATLTRLAAGKAAQSQDALWYDVKTRNQAIDSLGKKQTTPTKANEKKQSGGGIFSGITSVIGSVVGALGGIGGGILSALSIVARLSPILGIIGVIASAYVIKELGKAVDFGAIGEAIAKFLGIDTKSEKGFFQQILEKLDKKFETTFFTDTKKQIEGFYERTTNLIIKNFGPQINAVGKGVAVAVDIATVYTKAAFQTLADGFSGIGKAIGFLFNEFFQSNKGSIFAAIAAGLAIGYGGKNAARALAGLGAAGIAGLFGKVTGEQSREERKAELDKLTKEYADEQQNISVAEANDKTGGMRNNLMLRREAQRKKLADIVQKQAQLEAIEAEFRGFFTPDPDRFNKYLREGKAALPGGEFGGGYSPLISDERMSQAGTSISLKPTQLKQYSSMNAMSFEQFRSAVAGGEGGAAGYDAIYGFSQAGGDPAIKQRTGKNLSELTIGEVLAISNERQKQNRGAMGRYGLLPSTLEGNLKRAGLTKNDIFSPQNQDKLFKAVYDGMVEGLKREGFTTITNDLIRLAWSVGPTGARNVVDAAKNNPNMPVWKATGNIPEFSDEVGPNGERKPSAGRLTNPHLENTVEDYLKGRILSQGSVNMNDGRMELASALPGVNVFNSPITNNNVQSGGGGASQQVAGVRDMDALELFVSNAISMQG